MAPSRDAIRSQQEIKPAQPMRPHAVVFGKIVGHKFRLYPSHPPVGEVPMQGDTPITSECVIVSGRVVNN